MPAPIACGAGDGRPHVGPGAVPPPASCAGPARRLPASALDRVAPPRTVRAGPPLRALAHRRRPPCVRRLAPGVRGVPSPSVPCDNGPQSARRGVSVRGPLSQGDTGSCRCAPTRCAGVRCPVSGRVSPRCTPFSAPALTAPQQRRGVLVRNPVPCVQRLWTRSIYRPHLEVHSEYSAMADAMIETYFCTGNLR